MQHLTPLATPDWIPVIRRRQFEYAQEVATTSSPLFADPDTEVFCQNRRKRSRSRSKSPDKKQRRTSQPPARQQEQDKEERPLLEIEKLLRGGLARAYRQFPGSAVSSSSFATRGVGASSSSSSPSRRQKSAPSFSFALFPSKYHRPDLRSSRHNDERRRAESARRQRMLEQSGAVATDDYYYDYYATPSSRDRSNDSRRSRHSTGKDSAAASSLSPRAKDLIHMRKLGTEADQAPILRPQPVIDTRDSREQEAEEQKVAAEKARLFPVQFSQDEIRQFAAADGTTAAPEDEEQEQSGGAELSSSAAADRGYLQRKNHFYSITTDPLALTRKAAHILEAVDTPEPSDFDEDDGEEKARDLLFEANQILYHEGVASTSSRRNNNDNDNASKDDGIGIVEDFSAAGAVNAASLGRNVVSVHLSAVTDRDESSPSPPSPPAKPPKSVAFAQDDARANDGANDDDDDDNIGSRLLQNWHNFHLHDKEAVSGARVPWDPRMLELILEAPTANEARRAILVEKNKS